MVLSVHTIVYSQANTGKNPNNKAVKKKKKIDLENPKYPSYFGFQFRPIIPSSFLGEQVFTTSLNNFSTTFSQKYGYSFGATIRVGMTKLIAFETGINYNQRHFGIDASIADSGFYEKTTLGFVNYDIPLNALVYIQLSDKIYANAAMGGMLSFSPTNVAKHYFVGGVNNFYHSGQLKRKANFNLNASIGFEYRTEKKGFFYFGGSAVIPVSPLFYLYSQYRSSVNVLLSTINPVSGSYMTVDLKYFFPNIKNKGTQFTKGPIE